MIRTASRSLQRVQKAQSVSLLARSQPSKCLSVSATRIQAGKSSASSWTMRTALLSAFAATAVATTWSTAQAEEPGSIFSAKDVEIFCVIGPPLCGKATMCQRIARRFDMMNLGPEDDFFTEISTHQVAQRGQKLRVVLNGFPKTLDEAKWFEEEICPISAIIFVDVAPETAVKRTQERAYKAVKGGHKLFARETDTLIKEFRNRGNFLEINGALPLEEAWAQIDAKLDSALELSARGELI